MVVTSSKGADYLAFRPLLAEYVVSMPRGAAVVYPKDAAQIIASADVFPGAHVVEAGAGFGVADGVPAARRRALPAGSRRTSAAPTSPRSRARNVEQLFGGEHPAWTLTVADLAEALPGSADRDVDRVVLDMLAPWECVDVVADALTPGGIVCAYVATTTQLGRVVETLRAHGAFTEPHAWESLVRDLARRGARRAARPLDGRPHRVPRHRPADGPRPPPAGAQAPAGAGRVRPRLHRPAARRPSAGRDRAAGRRGQPVTDSPTRWCRTPIFRDPSCSEKRTPATCCASVALVWADLDETCPGPARGTSSVASTPVNEADLVPFRRARLLEAVVWSLAMRSDIRSATASPPPDCPAGCIATAR